MKRRRTLIILLLAVLSGTVAAVSAFRYLENRPLPVVNERDNIETRRVVIAAQDIPLGTTLGEEDLDAIDWPASSLPEGVATTPAEVVGRTVIDDVSRNEPILAAKLADTGLYGMIPLIPAGMRALTVQVDQVIAVAGFVTPQTRVDVILIMQSPGQEEFRSQVILQNVQVLAANQQITETEEGQPIISTVVTVLVTPEDAEKLALAETRGSIRMTLRNSLDLDLAETAGERESRLFITGNVAPAPSRARVGTTTRPPVASIIEVYKGGQRSLVNYR